MESDISVRPTEITRPVEVAFKAGPEYSGRTKPKWFVPFDVPTEIFGQGGGGYIWASMYYVCVNFFLCVLGMFE